MGVITTATALTAAGLAASAGTTAMSFVQAGKQRKLQQQAETEAAQAMAEARKKLDVNFYEKLGIQKEPYELQREAMLAQGAQSIQAAVEGEQRGIGATAGRVQMAQNEAQADIRSAMGQELTNLEKLTAGEESRLRDIGVNLDLAEVQGAQQAARDAQQAAELAKQQGIQGAISFGEQAIKALPLYTGGSAKAQSRADSALQANQISNIATTKYNLAQPDIQKSIASLGTIDNVDFSGVSKMSPREYNKFMRGVDATTLQKIYQKLPTSLSSYNPNALPKTVIPGMSSLGFAIPGVGGK